MKSDRPNKFTIADVEITKLEPRVMFNSPCQSCHHINPADSRFCNSCGALLDFPSVAALDALQETYKTDVLPIIADTFPPSSTQAVSFTLPRVLAPQESAVAFYSKVARQSTLIVSLLIIAVLALCGYYIYDQYAFLNAPRLPAEGHERDARRNSVLSEPNADRPLGSIESRATAVAPAIKQVAPGGVPAPKIPAGPNARTDRDGTRESTASIGPQRRLGQANPGGADVITSKSAPLAQSKRTPIVTDSKKTEPGPYRSGSCTQAMTALGLCTRDTTSRKE